MKKETYITCWVLIVWVSLQGISAQSKIEIVNRSFEGEPLLGRGDNFNLSGWSTLVSNESPPDVQPCQCWGVTQKASDGKTYLGMAVRDNQTKEIVYQKLSSPLKKGNVYQFTIDLCQSPVFDSRSRLTHKETSYTQPTCLSIEGITRKGELVQKLFTTEPVTNHDWKKYTIRFIPSQNIEYLLLSADYDENQSKAYSGHILVDNMSDIETIACNLKDTQTSLYEMFFGEIKINAGFLKNLAYNENVIRHGEYRHTIYSKDKNHFYFVENGNKEAELYKVFIGESDNILFGKIRIGTSMDEVDHCITERQLIDGDSYLTSSNGLGKLKWRDGKVEGIYLYWFR